MQRVLAAELAGDARVEVVGADALAFDYLAASRAAGRPVVVVGNLPYQISSALVLALVAAGARGGVARAVVMVQREMAQRIVAPPGSRTYGRLTVAIAQHAEARILFHVRPGSFHPAPAVTSSVVSLVPRAAPLAPVRDAGAVRGGGQAGVRDPAQDAARRARPGNSARTPSPPRSPRAASRDETRRAAVGRGLRAPRERACRRRRRRGRRRTTRCRSCPRSRRSCAGWRPACAAGASSRSGGAASRCTCAARSTCAACARSRSGARSPASAGSASSSSSPSTPRPTPAC